MNKAKQNFINSKVRMGGVRPTRISQPLPTSTPGSGGGPSSSGGRPEHYVFNDNQPSGEDSFRAGMAMDSYPEPLNQHQEIDLRIADFSAAQLLVGVPIIQLILAKGSAADKVRVDWAFSLAEQESVFDIDIRVNGMPFINSRWTQPYNSTYPVDFFRKMDTASEIDFLLVMKAGAVLIPPLGNVRAWLIVDAYRGTYVG